MYAVVAPGFKGVYEDARTIDKILALYPYVKFRKFKTEEECWAFIRRYENPRGIDLIYNYGDTFDKHFVTMEYFIGDDGLYYNFKTYNMGYLKISCKDALVENRADLIKVKVEDVVADNNSIFGHMVAIFHGLRVIGGFIDVNIVVPDHSVFYAINSYTGNNRAIKRVQDYISKRPAKVALSLKRSKLPTDTEDEDCG